MMIHTLCDPVPSSYHNGTRPCVYFCVYIISWMYRRGFFSRLSPIGCGGKKNGVHSAFSKFLIGCKNCLGFGSLSPLAPFFHQTRSFLYRSLGEATCQIHRAFLLEGFSSGISWEASQCWEWVARLVVLGVGRIRGRSLEMSAASHKVCHHVGITVGAQDFVLPRQKAHRVLKYCIKGDLFIYLFIYLWGSKVNRNMKTVSRIRDPMPFWPHGSGMSKKKIKIRIRDEHPGSYFLRELRNNFWVKNT